MAGVELIDGWVLLSKYSGSKAWHIAWLELFTRKAEALKFAADNKWPPPFKAVRANLSAIAK
jgi:hypothetical protein